MSNSKAEAIRGPMMALFADRRAFRRVAKTLLDLDLPQQATAAIQELTSIFDHTDDMVRELYAALPEDIRPDEPEREVSIGTGIEKRRLKSTGRNPRVTISHEVRWPELSEQLILALAEEYYTKFGRWPNTNSGKINPTSADSWRAINFCLKKGQRGLPGGSSLARLLNQGRGVPIYHDVTQLTYEQILCWADAHFKLNGAWPTEDSGPVADTAGETWRRIDSAIYAGSRGLTGGGSLARLLAEQRGKRHKYMLQDYDLDTINKWVLNHYLRLGRLPYVKDGPVAEAPSENWAMVDDAFKHARRGLANCGYNSLKEFLNARFPREDFGQRVYHRPKLTTKCVLEWADAYHERTGHWPKWSSGSIPEAPGETWSKINHELYRGNRGFGVKMSLAELLVKHRGLKPVRPGPLTIEQILLWADSHRERTGDWPNQNDRDPLPEAPFETWRNICFALNQGQRGLPTGCTLPLLLLAHRGREHRKLRAPLELDTIENWVRSHLKRNNRWPSFLAGGQVHEAPTISWRSIDGAFKSGCRGLAGSGYLSLDDFMVRRMGKTLSKHRGHWKHERNQKPAANLE